MDQWESIGRCCSRALEESLRTSGLSESEIEEIRKQNQAQMGTAPPQNDFSRALELSKREEEARLNRLREEDEELEKVNQNTSSLFPQSFLLFIQVLQLSMQEK